MVNQQYIFCIILLIITLGLCITSLSTDFWSCGNLFITCQDTDYKMIILSMIGLLILGCFCILLIIILDIISLCSIKFSSHITYLVLRFILLILCATALLIGVLLYTISIEHNWSYFCAVVGAVLVTVVVILSIMSSPCIKTEDYRNKIY
ncbi:unnamed protein product [Schistosoma spindalis]|nr:unnamed protein product [Schistosoma spindale]